jgi:hypothetical protein
MRKTKYYLLIGSAVVVVLAILLVVRFISFSAAPFVSRQTRECIQCHQQGGIQQAQILEWKRSDHAGKGVGCFECHQAKEDDQDAYDHRGFLIATIVSPFDCARCHQKEFEEFDRSHHARAGEILGSVDNFLGEAVEGTGASVQGCQYCHGSLVKVDDSGKLDPATWPNLGIGRLNPDGSKGTCSACHAKHAFSLAVARSPEACGKCHMGPDHPQKEVYDESKHGVIYTAFKYGMNLDKESWILGTDYSEAPNCVTCHMGANRNLFSTHDLGERISLNIRDIISKPKDNSEQKKKEMQMVCMNCHGPEWYNNFYVQYYNTVKIYDETFGEPASEIMTLLRQKGEITTNPFDEDIEWIYFELWHHEGRRARHGAAMMGPDYVQWHGFYEVAKHFYSEFLSEARTLGLNAYVDTLLAKPEHSWIRGVKPEGMVFQEAAFKEWARLREDVISK